MLRRAALRRSEADAGERSALAEVRPLRTGFRDNAVAPADRGIGISRLGAWVGFVFAVASAIVAYTEYRITQRQNKIERTLNYYNYYNDINAHQVSFDLLQLWDDESPALDDKLAAAANPAQAKALYEDFVIDIVRRHKARPKVLLMINFYNSLATCVTANLCDRNTALRFYGPEAKTFRNNYFAYVETYKQQNNQLDLTRPLEQFVEAYKALRPGKETSEIDEAACTFLPDNLGGVAQDFGLPC